MNVIQTVAAIELNHSTQNTALRMTIEMEYAFWETDDLKLQTVRGTGERLRGQDLTRERVRG